jgi:host factor-I protein
VIIYLINGAKLTGRIRSFDKFSILLESGAQDQLVFKHAISTISQSRRTSGDLRAQVATDLSVDEPPTQIISQPAQPAAPAADSPEP